MKGKKITIITSIIVIALIIIGLFTRRINNTIISSNSEQQKNTASNSLETDEPYYKESYLIEWKNSIGSDYVTEFNSAVKTPDGGIIAVGSTDTNTPIKEEIKKGYGNQDGIIVKYSSDGTVMWSKLLGGEGYDELLQIEAKPNKSGESNGEVYVIGGYVDSSVVKYDDKKLEEIDESNEIKDNGHTDGIVMTIDGQGNIIWAKTIGGTSKDRINAVTINENGEVGVTGGYYGSIKLGENNLKSLGKEDGFVCVFSNDGNYKWSQNLDSVDYADGKAITATSDGFVVGANFKGELSIGENKFEKQYSESGAVIGFSSDGTCKWTQLIRGSRIYDITNDVEKSEIIVVGAARGGILRKLNENDGTEKQAISIVGSNTADTAGIDSVVPTSNGGLLLGGWTYSNDTKINSNGKQENIVTSNKGKNDAVIIELDASGNLVWSDVIQGELFDRINDIVYMGDGSCYAVGEFNSKNIKSASCTIKKDEALQNEVLLESNDSYNSDAFIIKYKRQARGQFTVHHVLKEEDGSEKEESQIIKRGIIGAEYTTQPKEMKHYELDSESTKGNTTGTYSEENEDVYYYYVPNEYEYKIEYYYDDEIDSNSTETKNAKYNSIVTESPNKEKEKGGYKLVKKEPESEENEQNEAQLRIGDDPEKNVIKFYYENTEFKNLTVKKVWEMSDVEAENYKSTIQLMRVKDGEKIPLLDKDGNEIKVEIIGNRTNTIENVPVNKGGEPIEEYALKEIKVEKRVSPNEDKWEEVSLTQFNVSYQIEKSDEHN